VVLNLFQ